VNLDHEIPALAVLALYGGNSRRRRQPRIAKSQKHIVAIGRSHGWLSEEHSLMAHKRLTPADVRNVAFTKPSLGKRGYNEDEVDALLDRVETEISRLDGLV
jgi:DivIVA domain-containing protein